MSTLIGTCNICDREILRIPGVNVAYPQVQEKEIAQLVISAAVAHLVEEHWQANVTSYPHDVFWKTTLE